MTPMWYVNVRISLLTLQVFGGMASKFNRPMDVAKPATPQAAAKKNIDAELGFSSKRGTSVHRIVL